MLQLDELGPDVHKFASTAIAAGLASTKASANERGWNFFVASKQFHADGLSTWIGVGPSIPPKLTDAIQQHIQSHGHRVHREHATIAHHDLQPLLTVTEDAIELPPCVAFDDLSTLDDVAERLGKAVVRRPVTVQITELFKRDLMARALMGDAPASTAFKLPYYRGGSGTFRFGRISFQMLAQGPGWYMGMSRFVAQPPCVLSFEFGPEDLERLIALAKDAHRGDIQDALARGKQAFPVPSGSIIIDVRAKRGAPDGTDAESFIISDLRAASEPSLSVEF